MPTPEDLFAQSIEANRQLKDTVLQKSTEGAARETRMEQLNTTRLDQMQSTLNQESQSRTAQLNTAIARSAASNVLTDYLMKLTDAPITLAPRFTDAAKAATFNFTSAEDYAPAGSFVDLATTLPGASNWGSAPSLPVGLNKMSVLMSADVGDDTWTGIGKKSARVAILFNYHTAHHLWMTTGSPTPDYAQPRLLQPEMGNLLLAGQRYSGIGTYDDFFCLCHNVNSLTSVGTSHIRIINLGTEPLHLKSFIIQRYAGV
jgi:hypothetical protein